MQSRSMPTMCVSTSATSPRTPISAGSYYSGGRPRLYAGHDGLPGGGEFRRRLLAFLQRLDGENHAARNVYDAGASAGPGDVEHARGGHREIDLGRPARLR